MSDFASIAQQFTEYYYNMFDQDRSALAALYRENSMLTFENDPHRGTVNIIDKLSSLPFTKIQHRVDTLDAQPAGAPGAPGNILVLITGALLVDEEQRPMNYVQTFQLVQEGETYYVFNDVFRLIYSAQ